jgi:hypothetical protein
MPLLLLFKVLATGVTLFLEVTSALQKLKDQFPVKDLSQLEEMLIKEKAEFMVNSFRDEPSISRTDLIYSAFLAIIISWLAFIIIPGFSSKGC